jgi:hypothetical protein
VIVHIGLTDEQKARGPYNAGIDQALFDVIGDEATIREVYGLPCTPDDYARRLAILRRAGLAVAPHVVIGLYYGQVRGEMAALEMIREAGAKMAVLVVLRPLPKTAVAEVVDYPGPATVRLAAELGLETGFVESCCTLADARCLSSKVAPAGQDQGQAGQRRQAGEEADFVAVQRQA